LRSNGILPGGRYSPGLLARTYCQEVDSEKKTKKKKREKKGRSCGILLHLSFLKKKNEKEEKTRKLGATQWC
jgi:hypothetical protein